MGGGALPRLLLRGPAPTWAAPAPATWAAPAATVTDGCAATYLKGISTTTFDESVCTISGYLEKAFAIEGTINADNPVTTTAAGSGFRLLTNPNSIVLVDDNGDSAATSPIQTHDAVGGYADDLVNNNLLNPLGLTGLQYCHCVAVAKHGCDPGFSVYGGLEGVNAAFVAAAATNILNYGLATGMTSAAAAATTRPAGFNVPDLYNEYNALS